MLKIHPTARALALPCAAALGAILLAWARKPYAFFHPQLWAEDATLFLAQSLELGPASFLNPYAGYYHTLQRIIALIGLQIPAGCIPAFYAACAVGVTGIVSAHAAIVFSRWIPGHGWAIGLFAGLSPLLVPHTGEVFGNLTNLHWFGALGLIVLLIEPQSPPPGTSVLRLGWAMLLAASGPFSLFFAPIAWASALLARTRYSVALALSITACAVVHAFAMARFLAPHTGDIFPLHHCASRILDRTLGVFGIDGFSPGVRLALETVLALWVAFLVVQSVRRASAEDRRHLVLLSLALCVLTAAVYVKFRRDILSLNGIEAGDRYFYLQRCLLVWIVLACARHLTTRSHQIAVRALVVPAALGLALHWGSTAWTPYDWSEAGAAIDRGEPIRAAIQPPGWYFEYPGREK